MAERGSEVSRGTGIASVASAVVMVLALAGGEGALAEASNAAEQGSFSPPFAEPEINGKKTDKVCIKHEHDHEHGDDEHGANHGRDCKPAAGSMTVLASGDILYWNALEGTENITNGIGGEFGNLSINDQSRVLDLDPLTWRTPSPSDGGANPNGGEPDELFPGSASKEPFNDGALFCSDHNLLADGRVIAAGGTMYYDEPVGQVELQGLENTRIYDPATNEWTQSDNMKFGRWYPTMVTLGDGDIFIASGVKKLIKPVYTSRPSASGRNVVETETFDIDSGKWRYNGASADRSLPLFPRLHLLPNGDVYYNSAGQTWNPFGQSYDEPMWNMAATYDTKKKEWNDVGVPGLGTLHPGFRGSTFSVMLPLTPDRKGGYNEAELLSGGGTLGTSPGSYAATPFSAISTVDTSGEEVSLSTRATGNLNEPRWYSTAVLLPTGEVAAFSGADRDEVIAPGTGFPTNRAELFDPKTETWEPVAASKQLRTYHNTAALLPDGRVLVGGHAPITTLYGNHTTLPGGFSPNDGRDPSFEIFSPPYLFRGSRPEIRQAPEDMDYGRQLTVVTDTPASQIDSVVLVRNTSITHLVDGDQRNVELEVLHRAGNTVTVAAPPNGNVAPPGHYMLFVNKKTDKGAIPSVSQQVVVGR